MILRALLWKDLRQHARLLAAGVVVVLIPYVLVTLVGLIERATTESPNNKWTELLRIGVIGGFGASLVLVPFFSGNSLAGERGDRTAEFLACLPIPRGTMVTSKFIAAVVVSSLLFAANAVVGLYVFLVLDAGRDVPTIRQAGVLFGMAFVLFTTAWCASSFARSAALAAAAGLGIPMALLIVTDAIGEAAKLGSEGITELLYWSTMIVAVIALGVGTLNALRQRELR
ncbi:MAG: ABC transporter permease subunit [Planctomycetota bacterium]